jgi:hypothetical protein
MKFSLCLSQQHTIKMYGRLEVHLHVLLTLALLVFWVAMPCEPTDTRWVYDNLRQRRYVPPELWYPPASLHGVTTQKTSIDKLRLLVSFTLRPRYLLGNERRCLLVDSIAGFNMMTKVEISASVWNRTPVVQPVAHYCIGPVWPIDPYKT